MPAREKQCVDRDSLCAMPRMQLCTAVRLTPQTLLLSSVPGWKPCRRAGELTLSQLGFRQQIEHCVRPSEAGCCRGAATGLLSAEQQQHAG